MEQTKLSTDTANKVILCRAAIAWNINAPLSIELLEVDPPKACEVRIKILSSGICGTDLHALEGRNIVPVPVVLGHEGAGIVESVGEGVTSVNPAGLTLDGPSRLTCGGQEVHHLYGTSTFTECTVVHEIAVVTIDAAPVDKVCITGCEVPPGFGAVCNTAKVTPGSTCIVFGLGGIGSAIVTACKASGASRIIGVDINETKFPRAKALGVTDCLNPQNLKKPVQQVVVEMTGFGVDFAFEAIGLTDTMVAALDSCSRSYGVCVIMGVAPRGEQLSFDPLMINSGRTLKGSILGEYKSRDCIPKLITDYMQKKINIDPLITHTFPFEEINKAFEVLQNENCICCVLLFGDPR